MTKKKCKVCARKLSIVDLAIKCECGALTCAAHRYSWLHACTINRAGREKRKLQRTLRKATSKRVAHI